MSAWSFGRYIGYIHRRFRRFMDSRMGETGLTVEQMIFLANVGSLPGSRQDDIAAEMALDKGGAARGAHVLEEMGLIRREVDPEDRRCYMLWITERGAALREEVLAALQAWRDILTDGMTEAEREQTEKALALLRDNAERSGGEKRRAGASEKQKHR
ncbi:MarR family winged helix-turn-helix transcriptional regulator [Oscillospiraceae bacterium OttesenSCG-928-F05]|nr:MarR family winged helix-turn-helix transcriptional regulator [Oscillospiraceae bacterium OttesenSCG-928-F05]